MLTQCTLPDLEDQGVSLCVERHPRLVGRGRRWQQLRYRRRGSWQHCITQVPPPQGEDTLARSGPPTEI